VLAGDLWLTMVDPSQLENAIVNLAVNARDAMPEGGRLSIETANATVGEGTADLPPGDYVVVSVGDTGGGIPPEVLDKVFDPFFTTKEVGKGTGLGLSMVYGFVRQSRGQVTIRSIPEQGTTVTIHLPRWRGVATEERAAPASAESIGPERGAAILVVEDDPAVRRLTLRMLAELQCRAIEAADPQAALRILEGGEPVDLLLSDVVMPDLDGPRLAQLARELRPGLRVLFTTGYARQSIPSEGMGEAGPALLPKPFTLEQLSARLREVLDEPASREGKGPPLPGVDRSA
jgi:CheY-like chemotaxis protein